VLHRAAQLHGLGHLDRNDARGGTAALGDRHGAAPAGDLVEQAEALGLEGARGDGAVEEMIEGLAGTQTPECVDGLVAPTGKLFDHPVLEQAVAGRREALDARGRGLARFVDVAEGEVFACSRRAPGRGGDGRRRRATWRWALGWRGR
jgi:hypothetical protein